MSNFTISWKAMGCHLQAWVTATPDEASILTKVPLWFEDWESKFSRFRPDSELNFLNQHSGQWVKVSDELLTVIRHAVEHAKATRGRFNPLVLGALKAAGYIRSFDPETFVPGPTPFHQVETVPDWRNIHINVESSCVQIPAHSEMDLGGIVKGWAAQEAAKRLSAIGPCLVDAGGDMVACGSPDDTGGWWVTLPLAGDPRILLIDAAIATSGTTYRQWRRDGQLLHHLIDPQTARPASSDVQIAAVIAPEATSAEAWAKAALIAGSSSPLPDLPTLLVLEDGSHRTNRAFDELIQSEVSVSLP